MPYVLGFQQTDTLSAGGGGLLHTGTSATLSSGAFGSPSGTQILCVDYSSPSLAAYFTCTASGTALTGITFIGGNLSADHAAGAPVASVFTPAHYQAAIDGTGWTSTAVSLAAPVTVSGQSGITSAVAVTGLTRSVTTPVGWTRQVKVTVMADILSTVAGDSAALVIIRDGVSQHESVIPLPIASLGLTLVNFFEEVPTSGGHTYTAQVRRATGSGSLTVQSATMYVEAL